MREGGFVAKINGVLMIKLSEYQGWVDINSPEAAQGLCNITKRNAPVNFRISAQPMISALSKQTFWPNTTIIDSLSTNGKRFHVVIEQKGDDNDIGDVTMRYKKSYIRIGSRNDSFCLNPVNVTGIPDSISSATVNMCRMYAGIKALLVENTDAFLYALGECILDNPGKPPRLIVVHGRSNTGKSYLLNGIMGLFSDSNCTSMPGESLITKEGMSRSPTELVSELPGKRYIMFGDVNMRESQMVFNTSAIKLLFSSDTVRGNNGTMAKPNHLGVVMVNRLNSHTNMDMWCLPENVKRVVVMSTTSETYSQRMTTSASIDFTPDDLSVIAHCAIYTFINTSSRTTRFPMSYHMCIETMFLDRSAEWHSRVGVTEDAMLTHEFYGDLKRTIASTEVTLSMSYHFGISVYNMSCIIKDMMPSRLVNELLGVYSFVGTYMRPESTIFPGHWDKRVRSKLMSETINREAKRIIRSDPSISSSSSRMRGEKYTYIMS